jgi:hypothetical protein
MTKAFFTAAAALFALLPIMASPIPGQIEKRNGVSFSFTADSQNRVASTLKTILPM